MTYLGTAESRTAAEVVSSKSLALVYKGRATKDSSLHVVVGQITAPSANVPSPAIATLAADRAGVTTSESSTGRAEAICEPTPKTRVTVDTAGKRCTRCLARTAWIRPSIYRKRRTRRRRRRFLLGAVPACCDGGGGCELITERCGSTPSSRTRATPLSDYAAPVLAASPVQMPAGLRETRMTWHDPVCTFGYVVDSSDSD